MLLIVVAIVVAVVRGIGQSVDWWGVDVIGNDLIGVMVGLVGVVSIVVGFEQGGGHGVRYDVLWVVRWGFNQDVGCGVIFFVVVIVVIGSRMMI